MPSEIIDWNAPSLRGGFPRLPGDLPHGLIVPPQEVRDDLAAANEKLLREQGFTLNEEAWVRELNRHTVDYYFAYLDHEVVYRETPEGPEVLAVGYEEILALTKDMSLEEQRKLRRWLP
jgi:hypothetical protein